MRISMSLYAWRKGQTSEADFLDLGRSEVAAIGTHVEISGVVKVGSNQPFFCSVSPTLEVFDNVTGATAAILGTTSLPQLPIVRGLVQPQDGQVDQPPTR